MFSDLDPHAKWQIQQALLVWAGLVAIIAYWTCSAHGVEAPRLLLIALASYFIYERNKLN